MHGKDKYLTQKHKSSLVIEVYNTKREGDYKKRAPAIAGTLEHAFINKAKTSTLQR